MDPTVISDTIQEFNGTRYYLCGAYFQRHGRRLHREVWRMAHGAVPAGFHVHHKNHDRSDNRLENLELMEAVQHLTHHNRDRAPDQSMPAAALEAAKAWHQSPEGREWHREHYRKHCAPRLHQRGRKRCRHCGEEYQGTTRQRFCSNRCKSAARRAAGVDNEARTCAVCGQGFRVNRYWTTQTCGRRCARQMGVAKA